MGKKNKLKQLLGRFNEETNSELRALPYSYGDVVYEMLLKIDLNHSNSLAVANVPYYLDEDALKELCSLLFGDDVNEVYFTTSTALYGNLKRGYRSGRLVFSSIHACRRAFDSINDSMCPFKIGSLGVKLPTWHKPIVGCFGKVQRSTKKNKNLKDSDEIQVNNSVQNVDDGWTTVTRKHKFSFPGKINRLDENDAKLVETERSVDREELHGPLQKKRRR